MKPNPTALGSWTNLHVFGLWEKTGAPGENLHRHSEENIGRLDPWNFMRWSDSANQRATMPPSLHVFRI